MHDFPHIHLARQSLTLRPKLAKSPDPWKVQVCVCACAHESSTCIYVTACV